MAKRDAKSPAPTTGRPSALDGDLEHYAPDVEVTLPSGRKVPMSTLQKGVGQEPRPAAR